MDRINGARALVSIFLGGVAPGVLVAGLAALRKTRLAVIAAVGTATPRRSRGWGTRPSGLGAAGGVFLTPSIGPSSPPVNLVAVPAIRIAFSPPQDRKATRPLSWSRGWPWRSSDSSCSRPTRQSGGCWGSWWWRPCWWSAWRPGPTSRPRGSAGPRRSATTPGAVLFRRRLRGGRGRVARRGRRRGPPPGPCGRAPRPGTGAPWFAGRWGFRYQAEKSSLTPVVPGPAWSNQGTCSSSRRIKSSKSPGWRSTRRRPRRSRRSPTTPCPCSLGSGRSRLPTQARTRSNARSGRGSWSTSTG